MPFSLQKVLAAGQIHPFYNSSVPYPPSPERVKKLQEDARAGENLDLKSFKILQKDTLYDVNERLLDDLSPQNYFRHRAYVSLTGGGSGSRPLCFITDVDENRKHRAEFGQFLQTTGLIQNGDWLLTTHYAGDLSLDLMSETTENAGAAVLSAGNHMSPKDVAESLKKYHVNVLCGESNQIVQLAHFISTLPEQERRALKLDRIIYTSEVLNKSQRKLIRAVLGDIKICSIMGSAEAGPWAVSHPDLTGVNDETGVQDFVFDTRSMVVEIFPLSLSEDGGHAEPLPEGEQGIVVQTSLSRMRNPVIRYNTSDVASTHPLPESAREHVPAGEWEHLRVLRLHGRDRRFGFKWDCIYFQFSDITSTMNNEECGILQWQVILDQLEGTI
ncbi:hypothetical protein EsDP_00000676 [Epichloe bromicola]|uniref:Uncharacterized protein n=1 Tax=Epichloe bromicola TaxID=79588 RepID=A0ABQ0CFL1_9HYPO